MGIFDDFSVHFRLIIPSLFPISQRQGSADWVGAHVNAFEYFAGVTALVVPDNLRTGVSRACRYELGINATYAEMCKCQELFPPSR